MTESQRIYRGGLQYHDHAPEDVHAEPRLHDGYWRHYHDEGGMVTREEDDPGELITLEAAGLDFTDLEVIRKALADAIAWVEDGHGDIMAAEVYKALLGRMIDSALGLRD